MSYRSFGLALVGTGDCSAAGVENSKTQTALPMYVHFVMNTL